MKYLTPYVVLVSFFLDQISKFLISNNIQIHTVLHVFPSFNLVHIKNTGMSFGMLSNHSLYGPYILAFVSSCVVCALGFWAYQASDKMQKIALGLIIGGALGNVWDRLTDRAVTDFLDFYIGNYHWPAFNFADVVIVCGGALLLIQSLTTSNGNEERHVRE